MSSNLILRNLGPVLDWQKHFPYETPREIQAQALQILQDNWNRYDVFVLKAPTAFGKTSIARTLINSCYSVSVITPTNLLVEQFRQEFPDTPTLSRLDSYYCDEWQRPCPVTRNKLLGFCKGCKCSADLARAKFKKGPGIYNYHTYLAHKLHRDVLVVDEAHNLLPVIREQLSSLIWQHDYHYPSNAYTPEQIAQWIDTLPASKKKHKKIQILKDSIRGENPLYIPQRSKEWFNGKGTKRGEPEERDCIKLLPVSLSDAPPFFWPSAVKKVVLMSATISYKDVQALNMGRRRVCYIDCKSPIPPGSRPIVFDNLVSVNRNNMTEAGAKLAQYIQELADFHKEEKGVIHATYQMASILSQHLSDSRFIFHTRDNKRSQYNLFRDSDPRSGRILVACGMYEGIDLPEDLGRWQVVSKVPWTSLGSPAVKHMAAKDPEWYIWETCKTVIQACGRICRTPEDFGVTYIPDMTFQRMLDEGNHMIPQWFRDSLVNPQKQIT